jgi:hypothetical protein
MAMRTLIFIVGGFAVWAACLGIAKLVAGVTATSMTVATVAFVVIWFLVAATNMWVGVAQAGYSFKEELPIFLLIFALPVAIGAYVRWKFL